jgi:two-component system sensor histidine kinase RegB
MQPVDLSWMVRLRWAAAALFLLLALAGRTVFELPLAVLPLAVLWGVLVGSNAALSVWLARRRTVAPGAAAAILALDTLLLTLFLGLSGGPSNPFSVLFLVNVALGAVVLSPRFSWSLLVAGLPPVSPALPRAGARRSATPR